MRNQLIRLANELEAENRAAYDLWTWLPSYQNAQERRGDYVAEEQPCVAAVIQEAGEMLAVLAGYGPANKSFTSKQIKWIKKQFGG